MTVQRNHVTTVSSRDFTRDIAQAKRAAAGGPVFITDRGEPAYALLKIEDYYRITGKTERSLLELMESLPDTSDIAFDPPRADIQFKEVDLG